MELPENIQREMESLAYGWDDAPKHPPAEILAQRHIVAEQVGNMLTKWKPGGRWGTLRPPGEVAPMTHAVRVQKESVDRLLSLVSKAAHYLELNGFKVSFEGEGVYLRFVATETRLFLRIQEKTSELRHRGGVLSIELWPPHLDGMKHKWVDGPSRLEEQIPEMAARFAAYARAVHVLEKHREEADRPRREAQAIKDKEEAVRRTEQAKRAPFIAASKQWAELQALRGYRDECVRELRRRHGDLAPVHEDWLSWVDGVISAATAALERQTKKMFSGKTE